MTKLQIAGAVVAVLIVAVALVIYVKRISPLGWGWYGATMSTDGIAIGGYDPVAYFGGEPRPGDPALTFEWRGAQWRFADAANRDRFAANPDQYAPQFGGFCAYASSKGFTAKCDPTAYRVHEGKLYLFNDANFRDKWVTELPQGVIARARRHWEKRR